MKIYNKLVRDNIPEIIKNNGEEPIIKILEETEYKKLLHLKLLEEVNEYLLDKNIEELADTYEVFISILEVQEIDIEKLKKVALEKRVKNGGFKNKVYLEAVK